MHTYPQCIPALTEIGRIVVSGAVEAQVLQIGYEVRDSALVYALALTEDVQLVGESHTYTVINKAPNTPALTL